MTRREFPSARGAAVVMLAFALLASCRQAEPEREPPPERIVRAQVVFLEKDLKARREPLPLEAFRIWLPYIAGDLYGSPTAPDFVQPTLDEHYRLQFDLYRGHEALLASLEPTRFREGYLQIDPPEARIARMATLALEADGIDRIGWADWVDAATRERLMLIYADRPLAITGSMAGEAGSVRYDIRVDEPGYAWVREQMGPEGDIAYVVTPEPEELLLAITPLE